MIVPNLMVSDMAKSLEFYQSVIGLEIGFLLKSDRSMAEGTDQEGVVFATLKWDAHEMMLQTVASMADDVPTMTAAQKPTPGGTIYFRGMDPIAVAKRASDAVINGPLLQWYGMEEVYIRDPDGHVLCIGQPKGQAPA